METALHTPEAHDAITAELVACTLGQRRHADRLELRMDGVGRLAHLVHTLRQRLRRPVLVPGYGPVFYPKRVIR